MSASLRGSLGTLVCTLALLTAMPDAAPAREFSWAVAALLDDAPRFRDRRERVRRMLEEWRAAYPQVRVMAEASPVMRDAWPPAKDLSDLSDAGLEALDFLSSGLTPSLAWRGEKAALFERVGQNDSDVELAALPTIRLLVVAASESAQLQTMSPAEWKARVTAGRPFWPSQ